MLSDRYGSAKLPEIRAVDLRAEPPERGRFLSPPLVAAVGETLAGEAAGAPVSQPARLCAADALPHLRPPLPMPELLDLAGRASLPRRAPLPPLRPHRAAAGRLPALRLDRQPGADRAGRRAPRRGGCRAVSRGAHDRDVERPHRRRSSGCGSSSQSIAKGEVDIIIGTQLVAKGHNFPLLTLVGVVDGDLGLAFGDMRAAERTFQLLSQVTGRAGRFGGASRALVQTYDPAHPVIAAIVSGDREAFYAREIEARRAAGLPPFGRLAAIVVSGPDRAATQGHAAALRRAAPASDAVMVLGPAEAPLAIIRGRHRFRLLAHAPRGVDMQGYMRAWLRSAPGAHGGVRVQVDIDPQTFL